MNSIGTPQIVVDLHDDGQRLLVRCPIWANDFVKAFPSRRWAKTAHAWACPLIRRNVEYARELGKMAGVSVSDRAKKALDQFDKAIAKMKPKGVGFPSWFPFKTKPQKHQAIALDKGYPLDEYALFMDMGTGKSFVAIALNSAWRMEGVIDAWVIVCKLSLRRNWLLEFSKHCAIPYDAYLPYTDKEREFNAWLSKPHDFKIMVVGVESLSAGKMSSLVERFIMNRKVSMTMDESSYIAGAKAERSKQVVRLGSFCVKRQALTGTPIPDSPLNVFMQFEYLNPNIIGIGDYYSFRNRYAVMGGYKPDPKMKTGIQIIGYQNLDELVQTIAPYTYQVLKTEVYDLPPKRYKTHFVTMTKKQREMYDKIRGEEEYSHKGKVSTIQTVLELALRLHQVCTGWVGVEQGVDKKGKRIYRAERVIAAKDNPKLRELSEIVTDAGRKQGVVWCTYDHEINDCVALLRGLGKRVGELHGRIPEPDRQPVVNSFEEGAVDWVVGNAATGGMGYTMNAASIHVFMSNTFKLVDRQQAEDRSFRYGQDKSLLIIDIVMEKSTDVAVIRALSNKQGLAQFIRDRLADAIRVVTGDEDAPASELQLRLPSRAAGTALQRG